MCYEQVESVWPVSGSVLVLNDKVYCVAGRSMYLDGGCRFLALNPTNGVKLIEKVMDDKIPGTTNSLTTLEKTFNAPVALADLLSSDGQHIFMKSQWFDLDGVRTNIAHGPRRFGAGPLGQRRIYRHAAGAGLCRACSRLLLVEVVLSVNFGQPPAHGRNR